MCGVRVLRARSARTSNARRACEAREKKLLVFLASLPSLALCFQPHLFNCSRVHAKIRTVLQSIIIKAVAICNNAIAFVEKGSNFIWSTYPVIMADTTSTRLGLVSGVMSAVVGVGRIKTLPFSSD